MHPRQAKRRSVAAAALVWVRNVGLIALLLVAWQLWGTGLLEHHEQAALASEFRQHTSSDSKHGSTIPQLLTSSPTATPAAGSLIARLQVPAIGLGAYVVEGTSSTQLSDGPAHYSGTALPGYTGNVAIAGHRTTFGAPFSRLGAIVPGDAMYLTTMSGERFTYRVVIQPTAVSPTDGGILDEFGDDRLTLLTSTPEISASQRLVVVGEYQPSNGADSVLSAPLPTTDSPRSAGEAGSGLATPGWRWGHLPIVLLFVVLMTGVGLAYRRILARFGRVSWLLLIPVWLAALFLLSGSLSGVLPTTL
jgi:sortase A